MTIGADMPLRLQLEARLRDTAGNNERPGDLKRALKDEFGSAFKTMVKTVLDADEKVDEKAVDAQRDERDEPDDKMSAPVGQGGLGQAIMALEQLLERQRQGGEAMPTGDAAEVAKARPPVADIAPRKEERSPADDAFVEDATETPALPKFMITDNNGTEGPATAVRRAESMPAPIEQSSPQPAPPPANQPASEAKAAEQQVERISNTKPVEASPIPAAPPTVTAAEGVQAQIRPVTTPASSPPQPLAPPSIADVEVISDRSSGTTRTLVIQLQPVELGAVTARLRLTSEGMHIQLAAENRVAAEHLARDHEALGKELKLAGVGDDVSSVTIAIIDRTTPTSGNPGTQANMGGQEQQAGARANGEGQTASGGGAARDGSADQHFPRNGKADEREEKTGKKGIESSLSRGLVV